MNLFKKRPKEEPAKEPLKEYPFTLAKSFKGFKKFPIVIHGNPEAEKNNELLKDADLRGKEILFREASTKDGRPALLVFIDGNIVGAIYDSTQIQAIASGNIESVFAKMEVQTIAGKGEVTTRNRVCLFAKML